MKKILIVGCMIGALASCTSTEKGTAIGAGTGAVIGGAVTNSWGGAAVGAVAGGLVGAAAGAIIADATNPGRCYWRDRYGRRHYVRCR